MVTAPQVRVVTVVRVATVLTVQTSKMFQRVMAGPVVTEAPVQPIQVTAEWEVMEEMVLA